MKLNTQNADFSCRPFSTLGNEKGMVLVIAMMTLLFLTLLGAAVFISSTYEVENSGSYSDDVATLYIAEAGIERAKDELKTADLNSILSGGGVLSFGSSVSFRKGSYSVLVTDNDDGDSDTLADTDSTVYIYSTGSAGNGTRKIEVLVKATPTVGNFTPDHAILTGGDLKISGSLQVLGTSGNVHSNGDIDMSGGGVSITGDVTASGSFSQSGGGFIGGTSGGGFPSVEIPGIDPENYRSLADYVMRSDGWILEVATSTLYDHSDGSAFRNWKWSAGAPAAKWKLENDLPVYDGIYFFEGNVTIPKSPGTLVDPWNVTIIATYYIEISGSPKMNPLAGNLLLVSGTDIRISGGAVMNFAPSVLLCHEQVKFSGPSPVLTGVIIAEDAAEIDNRVENQSESSGGGTITYNGGLAIPLGASTSTGSVAVLSWREVKP